MAIPTITASQALNAGVRTRMYIQAVGAEGGTGAAWTEAMRVPLSRDVAFTPTGTVQAIQLFGEDFDRAVKTGKGGSLSVTTLGDATDTVVMVLLAAAAGVGPDARVRFLVVNPDLRAYVGIAVVETETPEYDNRNVFAYAFPMMTDGTFVPFNLLPADIAAAPAV